ncbi:MAG: response regulator, partial [Candidatus Cloacimonadota bacterium]
KNGEMMWMHVSGAPLRDGGGKVIGSVGVLTDVTESVKIREALNDSEAKYRSLFENAVVGILQSTLDDRYVMINPSYARILGYDSPEEAVAAIKDIHSIYVDPRQREILKEALQRDGHVENFEAALYNKQGQIIWVLINAKLEINSRGEQIVGATSIDITSRRQADLERQKLYSIIDGNLSEIYILDPFNLNITYANLGASRNTGYSKEELLRMKPTDICPDMNEPEIHKLLEPLLAGKKNSVFFETRQRRKDGSIYPVEIDLQYQEYPGEKIMVAMINDITESKSLQDQLIASQKMEAVGQLAGGIAHDFNNLLTVILGYGEELISSLEADDPLMISVDEMVKAGKRAAQLTQQLLAFSRKQVAQPRNLDLNNLIHNMESMFVRVLGENIKFQTNLSTQLDAVFADPGQMEQVIMNIVVNARDAMPLGGLIKINTANLSIDEAYQDTHTEIAPGDYVILSISDDGCGMSKEIQNRVYEPFFTTKSVGRGSGLGLSIVYGLVQQSRGHILLYSEEGEGTTFKILFPAVRGEYDSLEERGLQEMKKGSGESILIVEDEDALRRYISRMITGLGYKVSSCSSGMEALETIRHGLRPDLIVTDIVMPGINGREMAEQVREIVPRQKVLFVSGFNDDVLVNQGIINADLTYIQKPFSKNEISNKIAEMLKQGGNESGNRNFHILLLDDDEGIRNLYKRSFERKGYLYQAAACLEDALDILSKDPVDLLLLDMNLGVISGEQALAKIREEGYLVPVVLLSGLVDPQRVSALRSMGVVQFFEKGFTNQALYDFVKVLTAAPVSEQGLGTRD